MMRSAKINGGTETAKFGDMVSFNDGEGRQISGAITDIFRAHGNVCLQLDRKWQVEAWYARLAQIAATVKPGSPVTLQRDLVHEQVHLVAGTVIRPLYWRVGAATVELPNMVVVRLPMLALMQAAFPDADVRLVRWER